MTIINLAVVDNFNMEINEENFKTLAQYLQQTLSPDQNVRRPGKCIVLLIYSLFSVVKWIESKFCDDFAAFLKHKF